MANNRKSELDRAHDLACEISELVGGQLRSADSKDTEGYYATVIASCLIAVRSAYAIAHAEERELSLLARVREILSGNTMQGRIQLDAALTQCIPNYESLGDTTNLFLTMMWHRSPSVVHGAVSLCAVVEYVANDMKKLGFDLPGYLESAEGRAMIEACRDSLSIPLTYIRGKDVN